MALRAEEAEAAFIQSVCSRVRDDLAPELVDQCDAFVRQFYHWVPREDLAERSTHDLYGAAIAVWELARDRAPRAFNVRAYNPVLAEHGWRSTNTIVDVATDHMPFLVDSVGMELSRRGYGIQLSIHPVIDVLRDAHGRLVEVLPAGARLPGVLTEPLMQFEIDRETQPERLEELVGGIRRVLADVMVAVEDWPIMRRRMHEIADAFVVPAPPLHRREGGICRCRRSKRDRIARGRPRCAVFRVRRRRDRPWTRTVRPPRDGHPPRPRPPPGVGLAARSCPRVTSRRPLANARSRRPARRPVQDPPGAHRDGPRGVFDLNRRRRSDPGMGQRQRRDRRAISRDAHTHPGSTRQRLDDPRPSPSPSASSPT